MVFDCSSGHLNLFINVPFVFAIRRVEIEERVPLDRSGRFLEKRVAFVEELAPELDHRIRTSEKIVEIASNGVMSLPSVAVVAS